MTTNVGTLDRAIRFIIGALLILAPFVTDIALFQTTAMMIVAVIVGLVLMGTSLMKFCPIYRVFGLRTCKAQ